MSKVFEFIARLWIRRHDDSLRAGQYGPAQFSAYRAMVDHHE